ncbi:MAG: hypothetical protein QOH00_2607 [Gaiellales bacterium]|jgi:hypothetical protein|nr:hypothetical protein [Gaiellales bacterium]
MRALKIIVAIEAAMLALTVGLLLHSERHVSFPGSIAASPPPVPRGVVVPISLDVGSMGATRTATPYTPRGGQAAVLGASSGSGIAGYRRATVRHAGRAR